MATRPIYKLKSTVWVCEDEIELHLYSFSTLSSSPLPSVVHMLVLIFGFDARTLARSFCLRLSHHVVPHPTPVELYTDGRSHPAPDTIQINE